MTDISLRVNEHYGDNLLKLNFPESWSIEEVKMVAQDTPPLSDDQVRDAFACGYVR
jgi:hypothetical protein